jgi:hypothetical protein
MNPLKLVHYSFATDDYLDMGHGWNGVTLLKHPSRSCDRHTDTLYNAEAKLVFFFLG